MKKGLSYERRSLQKPWDEVAKVIMRYVTLEGYHKTIYAYHFRLLNHFRYAQGKEVNFPFFISHSMKLLVMKCKETQDKLPRHRVIKLVFDIALAR